MITERKVPFSIPALKIYSWITVGYFFIMFLSLVISNEPTTSFSHLGRKTQFLLAPFVVMALYKVDVPLKKIVLSLKIATIILGLIVVVQYSLGVSRPSGMFNANIFGDIVTIMLFLSIVMVVDENKNEIFLTHLTIFMGVFAIVLSGSRGSWLTFIILFLLYAFMMIKYHALHKNKRGWALLLTFFVALGMTVSTNILQSRVANANIEIKQWNEEGNSFTSIGTRLEMWTSGIEAFQDAPWFGYGYRNATVVTSRYVSDDFRDTIIKYSHLHNEYITNLVSAGIVGFLFLLILLLYPLKIFTKSLHYEHLYLYSLMGVILCVSYVSLGLTHIAFGEEHVNAFYIFFLAILMPYIIKNSQERI